MPVGVEFDAGKSDQPATIVRVKPNSVAERRGLRAGWTIVAVGGVTVASQVDVITRICESRDKGIEYVDMELDAYAGDGLECVTSRAARFSRTRLVPPGSR